MKELLAKSLEYLKEAEIKTHGLACLIEEIEKELTPLTQTVTIEWFCRGEKPSEGPVFYKIGDIIFYGYAEDGEIRDVDNEPVENWTHYAPYSLSKFFPFDKLRQ